MDDSPTPKWYRYQRTPGTTLAGTWLLAWLASRLLLATLELGPSLRVAVALLPLPFFGHFLWRFMVLVRQSDELQRRIQLEALAIAFLLTVALLMTVGLLHSAGSMATSSWLLSELWIYAVLFYLIGRGMARRRYA